MLNSTRLSENNLIQTPGINQFRNNFMYSIFYKDLDHQSLRYCEIKKSIRFIHAFKLHSTVYISSLILKF